jgi:hypothetical protein
LDLLPIGEGSFLPPRKQNQKDFKQSNPQTENAQIIQTPHRKKTVDKPSLLWLKKKNFTVVEGTAPYRLITAVRRNHSSKEN